MKTGLGTVGCPAWRVSFVPSRPAEKLTRHWEGTHLGGHLLPLPAHLLAGWLSAACVSLCHLCHPCLPAQLWVPGLPCTSEGNPPWRAGPLPTGGPTCGSESRQGRPAHPSSVKKQCPLVGPVGGCSRPLPLPCKDSTRPSSPPAEDLDCASGFGLFFSCVKKRKDRAWESCREGSTLPAVTALSPREVDPRIDSRASEGVASRGSERSRDSIYRSPLCLDWSLTGGVDL